VGREVGGRSLQPGRAQEARLAGELAAAMELSGGVAGGSSLPPGFPSRGRSYAASPARLGRSGAQSSASAWSSVVVPTHPFAD
jgi:hypothetical protein